MATRKIEKGSPESKLFRDFYAFRQNFYDFEDNDEWWVEVTDAGRSICEKYKNEPFYKFSIYLINSHLEDLEVRSREKKGVKE